MYRAAGCSSADGELRDSSTGMPDIADILSWTIHRSCSVILELRGLWALRGLSHLHRSSVIEKFRRERTESDTGAEMIENIRERELVDLEEQYRPKVKGEDKTLPFEISDEAKSHADYALLAQSWNEATIVITSKMLLRLSSNKSCLGRRRQRSVSRSHRLSSLGSLR